MNSAFWRASSTVAIVALLIGCGESGPELGADPCTGQDPSAGGVNPYASDAELRSQSAALRRSTYWMEHPGTSAADACAAANSAARLERAAANRAARLNPVRGAPPAPARGQGHTPIAPALPRQQAANGEELATILNVNGHLCARVVSVNRLTVGGGRVFEVTCVEYRSGSATVNYRIDMRQNTPIIY